MNIILFIIAVTSSLLAVLVCYVAWTFIRVQNLKIDLFSLVVDLDHEAQEKGFSQDPEYLKVREDILAMVDVSDTFNGAVLALLSPHPVRGEAGNGYQRKSLNAVMQIALDRCFNYAINETLSGKWYWQGVKRKAYRQISLIVEVKTVNDRAREFGDSIISSKNNDLVSC